MQPCTACLPASPSFLFLVCLLCAPLSLQGAQEAFSNATKCDPENAEARLRLAITLRGSGTASDATKALEELRSATTLDPSFTDAHLALGWTLLDAGKPRGAVDAFIAAISSSNGEAKDEAAAVTALTSGSTGQDMSNSSSGGTDSAEERARYVEGKRGLGHAWRAAGDLSRAIAAYADWVRLAPASAPALRSLGAALVLNDDHRRAITAYQVSTSLFSPSVHPRVS